MPKTTVVCPMCAVAQEIVVVENHSEFCAFCDEPMRVGTRVNRAVTGWTCEDCIERGCYFSRHNITGVMPEEVAAAIFTEDAKLAASFGVDVDTYRRWMLSA